MEQQTPLVPGTLGLHVLSGRVGESTIVTLPDGKWFLVDAFRTREYSHSGHNIPRIFSNAIGLDDSACIGVFLTHLHQDHYSGIKETMSQCTDVPLYLHAAYFASQRQREFYDEVIQMESRDSKLERPSKHSGILPLPISRNAAGVIELWDAFKLQTQIVQWQDLFADQDDFSGTCVAPSNDAVEEYLTESLRLGKKINDGMAKGQNVEERRTLQNVALNNMSVALLLEFGSAKVLLTGDLEENAWQRLEHQYRDRIDSTLPPPSLDDIVVIKLPHHGSNRARHPLLRHICESDSCYWGFVTHHKLGHARSLPDQDCITDSTACNVRILIPNRERLEKGIEHACAVDDGIVIERISILIGKQATADDVRSLQERTSPKVSIAPAPLPEVDWMSLALRKDGTVAGVFGGAKSVVLSSRRIGS